MTSGRERPGRLSWLPILSEEGRALVAEPVAAALTTFDAATVLVAAIDAELADTAQFCDAYGVAAEDSANCVVIAGRRGGETRYAACVVLATTRADVNGVVRRRLDARKASFAPMADAVQSSGMAYGGITPVGLPASWPVLIDAAVLTRDVVVVGSGRRDSKIALPPAVLTTLATAEIVDDLAG